IGKGSNSISGVKVPTTDQRGVSRPASSIDIGAFQDRGFQLTILAGSSPQSTLIDTAFPDPLRVLVTSPYGDPIGGGVIAFKVVPPPAGAGAPPSAGTATIAANGLASVKATANGTPGNYQVTASAAGARNVARFQLTNRSPTAGPAVIGIGTGSNRSAIGPA